MLNLSREGEPQPLFMSNSLSNDPLRPGDDRLFLLLELIFYSKAAEPLRLHLKTPRHQKLKPLRYSIRDRKTQQDAVAFLKGGDVSIDDNY